MKTTQDLLIAVTTARTRIETLYMFEQLSIADNKFSGRVFTVLHFAKGFIMLWADFCREKGPVILSSFSDAQTVRDIVTAWDELMIDPGHSLQFETIKELYHSFSGTDATSCQDWLYQFVAGNANMGPLTMLQQIDIPHH